MASIVIEERLRDGESRRDSTFLASTSTVYPSYTASKDDANHKITLNFQNNSSPTIRLAKDQASGEYIANSLMIKIYWAGTSSNSRTPQEVILVNGDAYGCEWYCNGVKLTPDNASVVVADGSTIYAKPLVNAADVPTETTTKVRIRGYWQTNTTPYSNTGCYNKPSIIQRYVNYTIDWVPPDLSSYSEINKPKIIGYLIVFWKGDWGSLEGVTGIGGIDMTDGDSTSFVSPSKWFSGANGHHLKHTVFTIFNTGISPKISDVISECISERPTNHKGTGDGNSVKDYSHYSKIDPNDTTQLYEVSFYMPDGETYVRVNQQDFTSFQVDGSNVVTPTGTSWITKDYMLAGWYRKDNDGAWGTELLTNSVVQDIIVRNKLSFKAKFVKKERNLIFDGNGGKVYTAFDSDTQVDQEHVLRKVNFEDNYGQMCNASRIGFILDGWYTSATGGTKVSAGTIMTEGTGDVIIYAHWKESWDVTMDDLIFLHYERPSVKMAVKRDSLENPEGVRLWVKPTIHPLLDKSGKDKNFVTDITDIYYRRENRSNSNFTSGGTATYDSRIYYNWQTANSESDIIKNSNGSIPAFDTGVLMNKVKTNNTAKQRDFDMDTEYQFRCLVRDALQSYYDKNSEFYGEDYPYKSDANYSPWGQYLNVSSNWTNADSVARLNCKSSGISDASNDGKAATLLKYVTKLLVHNPFMDEVLKESRSLTIVNHKPVWGKQLRDEQNPPETDFWQIREHTQNSINEVDGEESIAEFVNSILEMRSREPNEDTLTGGSVNGFNRQEIEDFLIPTLKRALRNDENLVYDYSQINPLLDILYAINSEHTKIAQEYSEESEAEEYSGLTVGDTSTASNIDSQKISKRILELDGERHQTDTNWETESDSLDNRVKDTEYKDVELRNFEQNQVDGDAQSTIDHIYDYDISQLDLKNSLSDLIYILSRMNPRQMGTEGAKANFNDPSKDTTNMSTYWDSANNRYKDSAFTNWIPSQGKWRTAENDLAEYNSAVDGNNLLVGTEALDPNNSYGENDFLNNGCRATCMGLCTSGCYQSCVGGCKTACGDSCFFGCKTTCTGACATGCAGGCGSGCKGSCSNDCAVACSEGCYITCTGGCGDKCESGCGSTCRVQCSTSCTAGCKNNCQGSCANGCTLGCKETCNSSCGSGCQSNCSGRCDKSCGGGCSSSCNNTCSTTCSGGCTRGCHTSCSTKCGKSCEGDCTVTCGEECSGQCHDECNSTCAKGCYNNCTGGCKTGCTTNCTKSCGGGCGSQCHSGCGNGCNGGCKSGCSGSCVSDCDSSCGGDCEIECQQTCRNNCAYYCSSMCNTYCSSGCSTYCKNDCNGQCSSVCHNSCGMGCRFTCNGYCTEVCSYGCVSSCTETCGGCSRTCSGVCRYDCTALCGTACTAGCTDSCHVTCGGGCKLNCSRTCSDGCKSACDGNCVSTCVSYCKVGCKTTCESSCYGGCKLECNQKCAASCSVRCITECKSNCSSDCYGGCSSGCQSGCGSSCASNCNDKCKSTCGDACTKKCDSDCAGGCKSTCKDTCSGHCAGGCKNDCGASCGTGCKNKCDKGCDTSCGVTCQSDCNNKCKNSCNDSCLNVCKGGCLAVCKNDCQNSCTANCADDCSNSCVNDGCTASCGKACGTSCSATCYGSCHKECTNSSFGGSAHTA